MTNKTTMIHESGALTLDEEAIERLIASRAGYCVTALGERLAVYRLDSKNDEGQYTVALDDEDGNQIDERCFKSAAAAAMFFETHRRRFRMGYDFEGEAKVEDSSTTAG